MSALGCTEKSSKEQEAADSVLSCGRFWGYCAVLFITIAALLILTISYFVLTTTAENDVRREMKSQSYSKGLSIEDQEMRPSRTHGIVVWFEVKGDPYVSSARWSMIPWREVDLMK